MAPQRLTQFSNPRTVIDVKLNILGELYRPFKNFVYKLNNLSIKNSNDEKILNLYRLFIDSHLNISKQVYSCVKKGFNISYLISANPKYFYCDTIHRLTVNLYRCYVRYVFENNCYLFYMYLIDAHEDANSKTFYKVIAWIV